MTATGDTLISCPTAVIILVQFVCKLKVEEPKVVQFHKFNQ